MINKSDPRCAVVRFCYHSYDYRPNWTPLSPITITYCRLSRHQNYRRIAIQCDIAAIFDKVESQGPLGRFFHAGYQFVFVWLWLIQTKRTCVRLCLRLRRALETVLAIHQQAAATAKSSSIFMLVYRYIFRVVCKSKPKKSKLTKKKIE